MIRKRFLAPLTAALVLLAAACNEPIEPIDLTIRHPREQNPAAWAAYLEVLNAYKTSEHYVTYARLDNAPEVSTSPKDFMNVLPDSLDMVALRRPLSHYDREDLPGMRDKGTKVLAWADGAAGEGMQTPEGALGEVAAHDLDGLVVGFSAAPDAARVAAATAAARTLQGKILIFEGDPALLLAADRDLFDYYILDATQCGNLFALRDEVDYLVGRLGIPVRKFLVGTSPAAMLDDTQLHAQPALQLLPACVTAYGPLGGLAVFDVAEDYYDPDIAYPRVKKAIFSLNPAAK